VSNVKDPRSKGTGPRSKNLLSIMGQGSELRCFDEELKLQEIQVDLDTIAF
jgi:hypothetical protein